MSQNDIDDVLDYLRRIKSGGDLSSTKIDQIETLKKQIRVFRTFSKYNHVLLPDFSVKIRKKAKLIVEMLHSVFDGIRDECKTSLNLERLESQLLEFAGGNTTLRYNNELKDSHLSEYMDCLGKNLSDVRMCLELNMSDHSLTNEAILEINRFIKQLKMVQKKMIFLRYFYVSEVNGYVDHEKLEGLEMRIQFMADNVGQFCLALSAKIDDTNIDEKDEYADISDLVYKNIDEDEDDRIIDEDEDTRDSVGTNIDEDEDDILTKPPYLLCLIVLVELEMKKIILGELKASRLTQSRTFKDKKLPKGFSHNLHSLLVYLRNKNLENFPNNVSAQNIDVAIEFLLVFLDADVSNHVINGSWLNEVLVKVGDIAGDILYVIQKLLPCSITKDDTSKVSLFSIQILEKTKDLKAEVEMYYKSLKFTPSQFPTFGGLSFLDSLLRKLNEMLKSESCLDFMMKPDIVYLEKELSSLTSILEKELSSLTFAFRDVVKVQHKHEEILKDLQRRTVNLAYESEVSIDSILVKYNALWHIFCSLPAIIKEIKHICAKVMEMRFQNLPIKHFSAIDQSKHLPTQHTNLVNDEEIVGFENEAEKIIQYLIRGKNELDVIPIVGMGGQGKTTIARKLYKNDIIISLFDVQAWCIISQTYNRRDLLQEIFSQVTGLKDKGDKDDILADELRKFLIGKRYLIVLDDMWDGMAWDDLRPSFPDVGNRSRIIVTTRLEKVAEHVMHYIEPYFLPFLPLDESCELLQKKVFQQEVCPTELHGVSLEIAEKCKGLPLVIILVAGIIKRNKMEASWWDEVKDALFDYLDRESEKYSLSTMQLSYDNLPDYLKPCLLYMGMFPEDAKIPVSKLTSLWIAEGFVQNTESGKLMEETAEGYLMELISSNVVMVSRRSYNGKVRICQVHDVVLHFCLEKSREEKFILAVKGQLQPSDWKGSRVSFSFNNELSMFASLGSKMQKPFRQHLRSLITTNGVQFSDWNPFRQVSEVRLLKVLDLSSHRVDYFSSATLKPLIHLKYLSVCTDNFNFHPEPHLPHLETLIVNGLTTLPAIFWKMEKLRHVKLTSDGFHLENNMQQIYGEFSKLENLKILSGLKFRSDEADKVDVLSQRCPNLQQLYIFFRYTEKASLAIRPKLEGLTQLQSLCISLQWPLFLSGLHLPSNLKKLKLHGTRIESVISFIAGLPRLEYLRLGEPSNPDYDQLWESIIAAHNRVWCLGDITFHKLKFLKLVDLRISRWDVSEESFPLLETLYIKWCRKLEEIPLSFADILTLKQIKLIDCNESLEASAVRIKEDAKENEGNDRIKLIIE